MSPTLSSDDSLPTPPGAWIESPPPSPVSAETPAPVTEAAPMSATPVESKKRSHSEAEGHQATTTTAPVKRAKKDPAATPSLAAITSPPSIPSLAASLPPVAITSPPAIPSLAASLPPVAIPSSNAIPSPAGTRSSCRTRTAPKRYADETSYTKPKPAPPRRKAFDAFEPTYITTNPRSRLTKVDIYHMLIRWDSWTCLTPEEKLEIIALLPANTINVSLASKLRDGTAAEDARPREFNLNFDLFRTDVAKFQEDLYNGHLGKAWQVSAEQAGRDRAAGHFDWWKYQQFELWYGQK